jgi:hypothetical protein
MITPEEIRQKAERAYPRVLSAWAQDVNATLFPLVVPANLKPTLKNLAATISAVERLRSGAKNNKGAGYTLHWKRVRSRDFGENDFPCRVTIDTFDDLLSLSGRSKHFAATRRVADRIREWRPTLDAWVVANIRTIARLQEPLEGLVSVCDFFVRNPWPDCYAREIPVAVDTKFVERHRAVLREWLDEILTASAIRSDESKFALRFGLRDGQPHITIRTLDHELQRELGLPFDEMSVPLRSLAALPVRRATVIIVENRLNLLTLPAVQRAIGIRGEGKAVARLERLPWLTENSIVYWGDIDVEGFQILSQLRRFCPESRSILMDRAVLDRFSRFAVRGTDIKCAEPPNLTDAEQEAFRLCLRDNLRLEQERIDHAFVLETFAADSRSPRNGT